MSRRNSQTIVLPKAVVKNTIDAMREAGNGNMEWFGLWLTRDSEDSEDTKVSEVYMPYQFSSDEGGRVVISGEELQILNRYLYQKQLRIVAQIHSHPEEAFHSWIDEMECIATTEGAYSIVVPNFGRIPYNDILKCAFFRLEHGRWMELSRQSVKAIFRRESK